ncbi:MAG: Uma2 family endonuclease [Symploca sp. SIO3E6]|nr:Uma2 family endonuclease [Caldora sp. SIO3E6]
MVTTPRSNTATVQITWPLLPDDFVLPDDPVENQDHPPLASALTDALATQSELLENALIVSNFALCAGFNNRTICKAPDWMYVRPVKPSLKPRRSYTPHKEGSVPLIVMEFISETDGGEYSMESDPSIGKWFFYERVIQIPYYVIFKPEKAKVEVYRLDGQLYHKQKPDADGRYWIEELDLYLGIWEGKHLLRTGNWLRWWDQAGKCLPWQEERALQAEEKAIQAEEKAIQAVEKATDAQLRAEKLAERLRELGIDPDQID